MSDFRQEITSPVVCEGTTCHFGGMQLTDDLGNLALAQLHSIKLRLYVANTGDVINGCTERDLKNTNNGTVTSGGLFDFHLLDADNVLSSQDLPSEKHVALITYKWAGGARTGHKQITFPVANQAALPTA